MLRTSGKLKDPVALAQAVDGATSIQEVLGKLGLRAAGGNYKAVRQAAAEASIELPVYDKAAAMRSVKPHISNDLIFVENSPYTNRREIKKRMLAAGVPNECSSCHLGPVWQDKPLTLQLEHKNGVWNDNRWKNLCLLCPNCHSQTDTFAGRASQYRVCAVCSKKISRTSTYCNAHTPRAGRGPQREYPAIESLIVMVQERGFRQSAAAIGVSDTALRKHLLKQVDPADPMFHTKPRKTRI